MILVAGSANLDFVVRTPHIPAPGETVLGHDFKTFPGGKGANQAVASARAGGATTHMLLGLGNDPYAKLLRDSLRSADVQMHIVRVKELPTGTAFICVADDGENAITVAPGANLALRAKHWPSLSGVSHLLLQLETPMETVTAYAQRARAQGIKVLLNAAPGQPLSEELLKLVDLLIVNEGELAALTSGTATQSISERLRVLSVPGVILTLGKRGCVAFSNKALLLQTAFAVAAVDTTGAGDTFCGTLAAALSQQRGMEEALRRASAAAALACTQMGAQSSIPQRSEVDQFLSQQGLEDPADLEALRAYCGFAG